MVDFISHNINTIISDINTLPAIIKDKVKRHLTTLLTSIQADLMAASPVGRSGNFKGDWDIDTPNITGDTIEGSVFNTKLYGEVLEFGSPKGGRPWGKAGDRTVESNSRIWSTQARGGFMSEVANDAYNEKVVKSIADNILVGI